jgi:parvulin-like peptidyl-prolyl cis-trans isomerase-like protein
MNAVARTLTLGLALALAAGCEKPAEPSKAPASSSGETSKEASKEAPKEAAKKESAPPAIAKAPAGGTLPVKPDKEPDHVTVQHILVSFQGRGIQNVTRSKEDAEKLAHELLERARGGENFDELVKKYTNDSPPGIYKMSNKGVAPTSPDEMPRSNMVPAFGNVGFAISPGNIDMAEFDLKNSPYGWHIIKRLE